MIDPSRRLHWRKSAGCWSCCDVSPEEMKHPKLLTVPKLVVSMFHYLIHAPVGMVLGSAIVLLMLWGPHGNVELLKRVWKAWKGPGIYRGPDAGILGIPWDQEWISYAIGFVLVVLVPCLLIRFVHRTESGHHHKLSDYGLGWPKPGLGKLTCWSTLLLFLMGLVGILLANGDSAMQATYPLYRGGFAGNREFLIYELGYFAFFFAIEFIYRGYLLFGLYHARPEPSTEQLGKRVLGLPTFGYYAIVISMLSYTAWHLGKPMPEEWSTLVWGLAAGTVALMTETIWPIIVVHWFLNVIGDFLMWRGL